MPLSPRWLYCPYQRKEDTLEGLILMFEDGVHLSFELVISEHFPCVPHDHRAYGQVLLSHYGIVMPHPDHAANPLRPVEAGCSGFASNQVALCSRPLRPSVLG